MSKNWFLIAQKYRSKRKYFSLRTRTKDCTKKNNSHWTTMVAHLYKGSKIIKLYT